VQIDVGSDGSCFYRAVYGAARYHPSGGILEHFYSCLANGFGLHNILGLRSNAARHMAAFVENEDTFVDTIRGYLASAVANTDFLTEFAKRNDAEKKNNEEETKNIYQEYYQWANTGNPLFYYNMAETSVEFQEAFGDPKEFLKLSEKEFKEIYAEILLDRESYTTDAEYQMVQFLLNRCGIQLESVNQADRRSPPKLTLTRNGQPLLFVRRLLQMEHYAYLMDKAVYDANKDMLVGPDDDMKKLSTWRKNPRIYSTSKLAKEAAAAAEKAAKEASAAAAKPVSKKKGKTRRKSSVNNSAVVAALANMGLTINTANANLIQSIRNSLK